MQGESILRTVNRVLAASCVMAVTPCTNHAEEEPSATPYRPTVSTPATLSSPRWLELELGGQHAHGGESSQHINLPYALKYAFTADWGIRAGGDAWVRDVAQDGTRASGFGDTNVILKRRFAVHEDSAFGLEGGAYFATAKDGLGSGKTDYLLTGIYSGDFGHYHSDINVGATRVGQIGPGEDRWQSAWATSVSGSFSEQWGGAGEFSGAYRRGTATTTQFLLAGNFNYSKHVVFDMGVAFGLASASPNWTLLAGVTVLLRQLR